MVDNQHKQITGYRDLQQDEIDLMNYIKEAEIQLAEVWQHVIWSSGDDTIAVTVDMRWANVAKTHFQEGFSALVRSIAKPRDPFKPDGGGDVPEGTPSDHSTVDKNDSVKELDSFIQ